MKAPLGKLVRQVSDPVKLETESTYRNLGVKWYAEGTFQREPKLGKDIKATRLYRVRPGQFIYNRLFASEGSFAVVRPADSETMVSNEFPVFDVDESMLLPCYLYLYFQQPSVWREIAVECVGTTQSRSRWKEGRFLAHTVTIPPLNVQRRILDLIGAIDESIAAAEETARQAEGLRQELSSQLWKTSKRVSLNDLGTLVTGATPSTKDDSMWHEGDVPFVTPGDLNWTGAETVRTGRFVTRSASKVSKRLLENSGVLQVCIGATVGKVGVVEGPALFNQQINAVFGLSERDARVLAISMSSREFQSAIRTAAGSSTMPLISKSAWGKLEVAWPDENSRTEWHSFIVALAASLTELDSAVNELKSLRSNMLTALLSGEHTIPESYDDVMEVAA